MHYINILPKLEFIRDVYKRQVERRGAGPVAGADRFGQDTPLAHDLPAALLGHVGRRLYTRHQQPRGTEDSLRGKQSRQAEHIRRGARIV